MLLRWYFLKSLREAFKEFSFNESILVEAIAKGNICQLLDTDFGGTRHVGRVAKNFLLCEQLGLSFECPSKQ